MEFDSDDHFKNSVIKSISLINLQIDRINEKITQRNEFFVYYIITCITSIFIQTQLLGNLPLFVIIYLLVPLCVYITWVIYVYYKVFFGYCDMTKVGLRDANNNIFFIAMRFRKIPILDNESIEKWYKFSLEYFQTYPVYTNGDIEKVKLSLLQITKSFMSLQLYWNEPIYDPIFNI